MYVHMFMFTCVFAGTHRGQKTTLDLLEVELQATVSHLIWVLGTKIKSYFKSSKHF